MNLPNSTCLVPDHIYQMTGMSIIQSAALTGDLPLLQAIGRIDTKLF